MRIGVVFVVLAVPEAVAGELFQIPQQQVEATNLARDVDEFSVLVQQACPTQAAQAGACRFPRMQDRQRIVIDRIDPIDLIAVYDEIQRQAVANRILLQRESAAAQQMFVVQAVTRGTTFQALHNYPSPSKEVGPGGPTPP